MKIETLKQLLALSKDEKSAAQVLEMVENYENKYEGGNLLNRRLLYAIKDN